MPRFNLLGSCCNASSSLITIPVIPCRKVLWGMHLPAGVFLGTLTGSTSSTGIPAHWKKSIWECRIIMAFIFISKDICLLGDNGDVYLCTKRHLGLPGLEMRINKTGGLVWTVHMSEEHLRYERQLVQLTSLLACTSLDVKQEHFL